MPLCISGAKRVFEQKNTTKKNHKMLKKLKARRDARQSITLVSTPGSSRAPSIAPSAVPSAALSMSPSIAPSIVSSRAPSYDDARSYVSKRSVDSKRSVFSMATSSSKKLQYEPPLPLARMLSCSSYASQRNELQITNTCPSFNYMDFIGCQLDGYCLRDSRDAFICKSCYSRYIENTPIQLLVKPCKAYPFITQGCYFSCLSTTSFYENHLIPYFKSPEILLNNLDLFSDHLRAIHSTQCFHEAITENNYESSKIYYNPTNDLYACDGCYQQQLKFLPFAKDFLLLKGKDILRSNITSDSIKKKCSFINTEISSVVKFYSKQKQSDSAEFNKDILHCMAFRANPKSIYHQTNKFYLIRDTKIFFCEICYYSFFKYWPEIFSDKFDIIIGGEKDICFCYEYDLFFQLNLYSREWTLFKFETFLEGCNRAVLTPLCGLQTKSYYQLDGQEFVVCVRCYETKCKVMFDTMPALKLTYKNPKSPGFCAVNINFPKYRVGYRNFHNQLRLMQCFSNGSLNQKKVLNSTNQEFDQSRGSEFIEFFKCVTGVSTCSFFERGVRGNVFYKFNIDENGKYPIGCCKYCYLTVVKDTSLESYFTESSNTNMKQNACFLSMAELQNQYFIACELGQPEIFLRFYYFLYQQLLQTEALVRLNGETKLSYHSSDTRFINDFHSEYIDKGHPITAATNVYFKLLYAAEDPGSLQLKNPSDLKNQKSGKNILNLPSHSSKSSFISKIKNKKQSERDPNNYKLTSSTSIKSNKSTFHNKLKFF